MPITLTFSTAGSFTIEDDGIAGNGTSIIRRDSDGAILAIIPHPADALNFRAIVPGVHLTFNLTDSLGTAVLTVGSLTDAAETPDSIIVQNIQSSSAVRLVSNGSITEGGSDLAADISASSIVLSAATGVGTPGNAIETQTTLMESETTTGGINIDNVGNLQVGGFSADVDGLDVVTSGNIRLTNLGSITLADETSFDSVHGGDTSGDVTLIANGYDSDITSIVDQSAIIAPRGSVVLTAGRDVSFGLGGADFGNDVRANGSIVVNAGRDLLLSGFADFFADGVLGTTGGNLIVNAGRNISLLDDTGNSASLAVLGSAGGDVILTAGPNGLVTLEPPSTNTLSSGSGSVIVNADRMLIGASSGVTAAVDVTLRPVSDGRGILLGSLSDSGSALELSDGELDRIFSDTLILGSNATGPITVGAPIAPASVQNFTLRSGTDIFAFFSLTAPNALSLFAGDDLHLLDTAVLTAATFVAFVDRAGDDGGIGGVGTLNGTIAASSIRLNGNFDNDTLTGTSAADIISGGGGADTMTGRADDDTYRVDNAGDLVVELVGEGIDKVISGIDYVLPDNVEILTLVGGARVGNGNALANTIFGSGGLDTLSGLGGDDILRGNDGRDALLGGDGEDLLDGGVGKDTMTGGADRDVFQFRDGDFGPSRALADIITDFSQADNEKISLILVDADTTTGGNQAFSFIGTGAFTNVAGQLRYAHQGGNTFVEGDLDGNGTADIFIALTGVLNLVATDFVL